MELINADVHGAVAPGPGGGGACHRPSEQGSASDRRCDGAANVYMVLRDAAQAVGIAKRDYAALESQYYFTGGDGSAFVVGDKLLAAKLVLKPDTDFCRGAACRTRGGDHICGCRRVSGTG